MSIRFGREEERGSARVSAILTQEHEGARSAATESFDQGRRMLSSKPRN